MPNNAGYIAADRTRAEAQLMILLASRVSSSPGCSRRYSSVEVWDLVAVRTRGMSMVAAVAALTAGCAGESGNPSGLSTDGRPTAPVASATRQFSQALESGSVARLKALVASNDTASDAPSL